MNPIKNKLRSKSGASLLFALLFLLFCVLVGGTVLAAASASSFRVTRLEDKQQELSERSAAQLIANELYVGDATFALSIEKSASKVEFSLPANTSLTPMQRVAVEMAVWKYLKESGDTSSTRVFTNFNCDDGTKITTLDQFWYKYSLTSTAEFTGTVQLSGTNLISEEAQLKMPGAGKYTLTVEFGEDNRYSVQMKAAVTTHPGETEGSESVTVTWYNPVVKKGGS